MHRLDCIHSVGQQIGILLACFVIRATLLARARLRIRGRFGIGGRLRLRGRLRIGNGFWLWSRLRIRDGLGGREHPLLIVAALIVPLYNRCLVRSRLAGHVQNKTAFLIYNLIMTAIGEDDLPLLVVAACLLLIPMNDISSRLRLLVHDIQHGSIGGVFDGLIPLFIRADHPFLRIRLVSRHLDHIGATWVRGKIQVFPAGHGLDGIHPIVNHDRRENPLLVVIPSIVPLDDMCIIPRQAVFHIQDKAAALTHNLITGSGRDNLPLLIVVLCRLLLITNDIGSWGCQFTLYIDYCSPGKILNRLIPIFIRADKPLLTVIQVALIHLHHSGVGMRATWGSIQVFPTEHRLDGIHPIRNCRRIRVNTVRPIRKIRLDLTLRPVLQSVLRAGGLREPGLPGLPTLQVVNLYDQLAAHRGHIGAVAANLHAAISISRTEQPVGIIR